MMKKCDLKKITGKVVVAGIVALSCIFILTNNRVFAANKKNDEIKHKLETAVTDRQKRVDVSEYGLSEEEYSDIFDNVKDEMFIYYISHKSVKMSLVSGDSPYIKIKYGNSEEEYRQRYKILEKAVNRFVNKKTTEDMCDYAKTLMAHEYLIGMMNNDPAVNEDAYYLFKNKTSSSLGYAQAYKLLLDKAGVECKIIYGKGKKEAANLVSLNGKMYYVDVFRDEVKEGYSHKNFLISDEEFYALHKKWKNPYGVVESGYKKNPFKNSAVKIVCKKGNLISKETDKTIIQDCVTRRCKTYKVPFIIKTDKKKSATVTLQWTKMGKKAEYSIYRAEKKAGKYTKVLKVSDVLKADIPAENGKKYYYKIVGKKDGIKLKSDIVAVTAKVPAPKISSVDYIGGSIFKLTIEMVEDADEYVVYGAASQNGKYFEIDSTKNSYYYVNSDMYKYFRVKAVDINGKNKSYSKYSNTVNASV